MEATTDSASPSASVSLAKTSWVVTSVLTSVVTMSMFAAGAALLTASETFTVTVAVSVPPLPSEAV